MQLTRYTTIQHEHRKQLGISVLEYVFCDIVHKLCTGPKAKHKGWCNASKPFLADCIDVDVRTIQRMVLKMVEQGLVERNSKNFLRTTVKWYEATVVFELNHDKMSPLPMPNHDKMSPPSDSSNNDSSNILAHTAQVSPKREGKSREPRPRTGTPERLPEEKQSAVHRLGYFLEDTLGTTLVTWGKQGKAVKMMFDAGFSEEEIRRAITYMAKHDPFFKDKGFDLMTVAGQMSRYKAEANKYRKNPQKF